MKTETKTATEEMETENINTYTTKLCNERQGGGAAGVGGCGGDK